VPFDAARLTLDQYAARVLERHYAAMLSVAADPRSLVVSYDEGIPEVFRRSARWLGLSLDAALVRAADERCRYDAKRPHERFEPQEATAPAGVDLAALAALVEQLDRARGALDALPLHRLPVT
jgi:predicted N-formylglutamate amidohydrolase